MHPNLVKAARNAIALHAVTKDGLKRFQSGLPKRDAAFLKATGFAAAEGDLKLIPDAQGGIAGAVLGLGKGGDSLALATFAEQLPAGIYRLAGAPAEAGGANAALAWLLGTYQFARYRKKPKTFGAKLVLPEGVDGEEVSRIAQGVFLGRDLISTPPNDMGPEELANAVRDLAKAHGAKFTVVTGEALLKQNYPLKIGRAHV